MSQEPLGTPPAPIANPAKPWWQSDAAFIAGLVLLCLAIAYSLSVYEVVSRAHEAWQEGEKYYAWMNDPAQKKAWFDSQLAAQKINQDDYQRLMADSDLKNAYVWYETATDLFQPPRSQWVAKSEERLKELKPKREAWLKSLGIDPVDDSAHPDRSWHW
jgi:hypothetical protein